jgi:hypothetical protein
MIEAATAYRQSRLAFAQERDTNASARHAGRNTEATMRDIEAEELTETETFAKPKAVGLAPFAVSKRCAGSAYCTPEIISPRRPFGPAFLITQMM